MALVQTSFTSPTPLDVVYERRFGWKYVPFVRKDARPQPYEKIVWYYNGGNTHMLPTVATRAGMVLWGDNSPNAALDSTYTQDRQAYARAYGKFVGKLYGQASLLTAVAERQSTINMVAKRLSQIHKGAKHLRKGQFSSFLRTFDLAPKPKHLHKRWSRPRDFASLWLEYWFGWAPTVGDVYSAIEFLGSEIPASTVRAGSQVPYRSDYTQIGPGAKATTSCLGTHTVWVQAKAVITNPTLYTMQGLGLANPLKTAWELVPFSWFADWFTNIGQVLGQLTDFLGLKVQDIVISRKTEVTSTWVCEGAQAIFGYDAPKTTWRSRDFIGFRRQVGGVSLPAVKPFLRLPNGLSITRGATLASLIVQLFAPKRAIN